jgi:hypothetical protein
MSLRGRDAIHANGMRYVLEPTLAEKEVVGMHHLCDLIEYAAANVDAARLGDLLETRCHVHRISADPAVQIDDIPHIDTDAEVNAECARNFCIRTLGCRLDSEAATQRLHGTWEFCHHPVTGETERSAVASLDVPDRHCQCGTDTFVRDLFVSADQQAVTLYVDAHHRRQPAVEF